VWSGGRGEGASHAVASGRTSRQCLAQRMVVVGHRRRGKGHNHPGSGGVMGEASVVLRQGRASER
jgi:hypothetical protein